MFRNKSYSEMSSRFLFETFVPPINIRRPATNPVIPMKVKPNAQEYVVTRIGSNIAPRAPPPCPIPSVIPNPELLALVG